MKNQPVFCRSRIGISCFVAARGKVTMERGRTWKPVVGMFFSNGRIDGTRGGGQDDNGVDLDRDGSGRGAVRDLSLIHI